MNMFCYQCEQTNKGQGCIDDGVCGKTPEAAAIQDQIVDNLKELSFYVNEIAQNRNGCSVDMDCEEIKKALLDGLFATVTNVSFDPARLLKQNEDLVNLGQKVKAYYQKFAQEKGLEAKEPETKAGDYVSITSRKEAFGEDIVSLQEILMYGLKGMAAYAEHAKILGKEDDEVYKFFFSAMALLTKKKPTVDELLTASLKCGEFNLKVMEMLDSAHTETYGHPEPTKMRITPVKGKAILVSGHDLRDLELLLQQTEGKGINVYTHGEMLPANAYPGLKKYKHLIGNYGGAWQDQRKEFREFPGSILMTTNCIMDPEKYVGRIFTRSQVTWPGVEHIYGDDMSPVINAALAEPGFTEDGEEKYIMCGFAHNSVLSVADKVIEAVRSGQIRHFFLVGGCDGAKLGRDYYTELTEKIPNDCVILTLACGKFRFNKKEFGDIGGIPRLLDMGQCNDAYSAIKVAVALAEAFDTDVNSLPLSMILSWFEQKAVVILLTLLHLGIRNIRLGPSLPAFITPNVLNVLVEKYNIAPIKTADEDLAAILGSVTA